MLFCLFIYPVLRIRFSGSAFFVHIERENVADPTDPDPKYLNYEKKKTFSRPGFPPPTPQMIYRNPTWDIVFIQYYQECISSIVRDIVINSKLGQVLPHVMDFVLVSDFIFFIVVVIFFIVSSSKSGYSCPRLSLSLSWSSWSSSSSESSDLFAISWLISLSLSLLLSLSLS